MKQYHNIPGFKRTPDYILAIQKESMKHPLTNKTWLERIQQPPAPTKEKPTTSIIHHPKTNASNGPKK